MDKTLRLYYQRALALHLPVRYLPNIDTMQITLAGYNYHFFQTITPFNNAMSICIAKNKYLLNKLLERSGFPVPKAVAIKKADLDEHALEERIQPIHFPVVVKPMKDTHGGKDVLCNIKDMKSLNAYLKGAFKKYPFMQVEEFHQDLKEYRVLVFHERIIGVVERFAAKVIGDGKSSIRQLIERRNQHRMQETLLTLSPLEFDEECRQALEEQGLSMDSIPHPAQIIPLGYTVNAAHGGDLYSHGRSIHPHNADYLRRAARLAGLELVGFDVLCEDIRQSFNKTKWLIIEANFGPDITLHEAANQGEKVEVSKIILRTLIRRHPFSYFYHRLKALLNISLI
ncbi:MULTISPECIES: UDP-N-acetylmuramyl peptide synthase [unclassified Legionella]|uniref:UDP-N-acetylmuramyl peptide synthase n=1 Tax=unclassified Legionella TaxID=2622702 RepID=UPI0010555A4C|nr:MULTISPECIES: UDP-N-acetylmuramyl peptide synthase [unclassified Legionella]MDI9819237.1 UDP-N-acetylmuramyl peptide synthase [Legionella sp. PL877]